ncbi:hypothetical protein C8R45DRAFT_933835 [Mycena sanguinolenta]|nr:hypothetical protein C8R45DRAFT_933835 [Mycena sanguinolenta]
MVRIDFKRDLANFPHPILNRRRNQFQVSTLFGDMFAMARKAAPARIGNALRSNVGEGDVKKTPDDGLADTLVVFRTAARNVTGLSDLHVDVVKFLTEREGAGVAASLAAGHLGGRNKRKWAKLGEKTALRVVERSCRWMRRKTNGNGVRDWAESNDDSERNADQKIDQGKRCETRRAKDAPRESREGQSTRRYRIREVITRPDEKPQDTPRKFQCGEEKRQEHRFGRIRQTAEVLTKAGICAAVLLIALLMMPRHRRLRDSSACDRQLLPGQFPDLHRTTTTRFAARRAKGRNPLFLLRPDRGLLSMPNPKNYRTFPSVQMLGLKKKKAQSCRATTRPAASSSLISSEVEQFTVVYHPAVGPSHSEQREAGGELLSTSGNSLETTPAAEADLDPVVPAPVPSDLTDTPGYEATAEYQTESAPKGGMQNVAHMNELRAQEDIFLRELLGTHHDPRLLSLCSCGRTNGIGSKQRSCWLDKHRTAPTHWALVWNTKEKFFEKTDICRVRDGAGIFLGHDGLCCPIRTLSLLFTLVDANGIHATVVTFCGCLGPDSKPVPQFVQLLRAKIFPRSIKEPKTGYTLTVLERFREHRNQDKGSLYDFLHVLQRLADPIFAGEVPDLKNHFANMLRRGHAHVLDEPLPGEEDRPYPNRPKGYLGLVCAACPERGVNMPSDATVPEYLRKDGNFKANQFFKRDDGSDRSLTNGIMYFPEEREYARVAKQIRIAKEDKEPPCRAHIGAIRHQGKLKYGNTAISGVVASACDHAVVGSLVDLVLGEAFGFVTMGQYHHLLQYNSPPHGRSARALVLKQRNAARNLEDKSAMYDTVDASMVESYDSYCSFVVNQVKRAIELFPDAAWLHDLLKLAEGQRSFSRPKDPTPSILFHQHLAVLKFLSEKHADLVGEWSKMSRKCTKDKSGMLSSVYQHAAAKLPTIDDVLDTIMDEERQRGKESHEGGPPMGMWIRAGIKIERDQYLVVALLKSHKEHALAETLAAISKLRDSINWNLADFREQQRTFLPRVKLSALDADEPELTRLQFPSYLVKHGRLDASSESQELQELEIKLRCGQANEAVLAVQATSLALSAASRTQAEDYRGQAGITRAARAVQKANLAKNLEITTYNVARDALIVLGHVKDDPDAAYPPLTARDTRCKETHLHRPKGDSQRFDGTAWYLNDGLSMTSSVIPEGKKENEASDNDESQKMLAGTQTLKRNRFSKSTRRDKRAKPSGPETAENSEVDSDLGGTTATAKPGSSKKVAPEKKKEAKAHQSDGWIWVERLVGREARTSEKMDEYKRESKRVQWFRAEAEMYRWREQYERKHAELMRVMSRFQRDAEVWTKRADRLEQGTPDGVGAVTYAQEQAAMFKRLSSNAETIFKDPKSAAHAEWAAADTFDDMIRRMDASREADFAWMDQMGIHRAYKDFKQPIADEEHNEFSDDEPSAEGEGST